MIWWLAQPPIIDDRSRVLILGSMPGPTALRRRQYYGFEGNRFWHIIPKLLGVERPTEYEDRIRLVRKGRIALWEVLHSCMRPGALDSRIAGAVINDIPSLLKRHPAIRAVFLNGRFAHQTFVKAFGDSVDRPAFYLPSTSPANASIPLKTKLERWSLIRKFLA